MFRYTKEEFRRITLLLQVGSRGVEENREGFYDVWFCYGGEYCLMVSISKVDKKFANFCWLVDIYPQDKGVHSNFREILRIQQNCRERITKLAQAACADL